jgi:hypothetical protein
MREVTSSMSSLDMQTDNTLEIYQVIKENFDRKKGKSESYMGKHRFSSSLSLKFDDGQVHYSFLENHIKSIVNKR